MTPTLDEVRAAVEAVTDYCDRTEQAWRDLQPIPEGERALVQCLRPVLASHARQQDMLERLNWLIQDGTQILPGSALAAEVASLVMPHDR
jgi:hypothetical protein